MMFSAQNGLKTARSYTEISFKLRVTMLPEKSTNNICPMLLATLSADFWQTGTTSISLLELIQRTTSSCALLPAVSTLPQV
jgi:hypothetical protein